MTRASDSGVIPFNRPFSTGRELDLIADSHARGHLAGDGYYTDECQQWLQRRTGAQRALLTHSCTSALEIAALLLELQPGDEVIMPSYTFVSTANAFVLRGAVPVFVDIRPDTLNIDERLIEGAITERTKAVCVVHYAGVAAEMDEIMAIALRRGLAVVEDAAQGILATYRGRAVGTIGDIGALSFHETKNIISGEGGALLCRDARYVERAEVIRTKGTDRGRFSRGEVDKYSWVDVGSSYSPGEVVAAFLSAQMADADSIIDRRLAIWSDYDDWAAPYETAGVLRRPHIPSHVQHNAHLYYLLLPSEELRNEFVKGMFVQGVQTVFHYVPLHAAPMGSKVARTYGKLPVTVNASSRLVRMPLWLGLEDRLPEVLEAADHVLERIL